MNLPEADLIRIFEATRAITSTLRLSELLETVMRLASEVMRADASSLLLMDPATEELYFDIALGEKGGELQQIRLKKGEGIAGWVAEQRKPAVVNDVTKDPRWTRKGDQKSKFQTRNILAVPMMMHDKLIGVMEVINKMHAKDFTEIDAQLMETFAAQAAIAIENARLFESIRQEKEKMSTILGEMSEGAMLLDASGNILLANVAARNLFDNQNLEGSSWPDLAKSFDIRPTWEEISSTLGGAGGIEITRRAPPPFILAGVINQVCNDRGKITGFLVIFSDVTEERRESQLKKNFLALVSHKLKTPLVAIRGFTPMLLEKPEELNSFQRTAIETIDRNSAQLTSLVEKLVWFSALEADTIDLTVKDHSVSSIVDAAIAELAAFLRTQQVEVTLDKSLATIPSVKVDKLWMKEVFRNLIENAVKFNQNTPRQVKINASKNGGGLVDIVVIDNGPGIPAEERTKIFQKFYQIEGAFTGQVQGMGLGLALVKRVVEAHGGTVKVDSTLGKSSSFTVSLPASA